MRRVLRYLLPLLVILLLAACQQAPGRMLGTTSGGDLPNGLRLTDTPAGDESSSDEDSGLPSEDEGSGDQESDLPDEGGDSGDQEGDLPSEDDGDQGGDDLDTDDMRCANGQQPNPAAQRLAAELDVDVAEIWAWYCQGYGLGEIRIAYILSAQSGTPVADLFAMYDSGLGWGEIAAQLGLKPPYDEDQDDMWRCGEDGIPNPAAQRLAAELDVDVAEIWAWYCQGYGLGEIRIAYTLSAQSGTPVADLFAMYDSGLGWGEIAQGLGLKPGRGLGNPHSEDNPTGNPHGEDNPTGNPHKDTNGRGQRGNPHGQ